MLIDVLCDDAVMLCTQYSTQWDSLAHIGALFDADDVEVEPGDMVCLHTGFAELLLEMEGIPEPEAVHNACAVLDGRDRRLLQWITESGLAVLVSDNHAVEAAPRDLSRLDEPGPALPLHHHCLFKLGVHLGELWYLGELAGWLRENGRCRFLLTAPPLRLTGAVGSPATPVATV